MKLTFPSRKERPLSVLVIRLSALGDVAMTLPAIYSLARSYPGMRVDVLTRPFFARMFIYPPPNLRVLTADFKTQYVGLTGMFRLFFRLRKGHYFRVADLHNAPRSRFLDTLFRLAGARVAMVDRMNEHHYRVLHGSARQPDFIGRYTEVFRRLGFSTRLTFRGLFTGRTAEAPVDIPAGSVGIAPFARYYTKTYPLRLMEQVVSTLCARGVHVFLFGARGDEASALDKWAGKYNGCTSLAGRYEIEAELALMNRLTVMVTMDSANHHLASLAGTRVLSIWGGTTPACGFMAYGQSESDALHTGLPCQPCSIGGSRRCVKGTLQCLRSITPESIASRVMAMLKEPKARNAAT